MQQRQAVSVLAILSATGNAAAARDDPLGKVFQLLDSLKAKVEKDAVAEAKAYQEYFEWCDDAATNKGFDLKTAAARKDALEAEIGKQSGLADDAEVKVGELASSIAEDEAELRAATGVRDKEAKDFAAAEAELVDVVDTLGRAISVVERQMAKSPAAFAQMDASNLDNLLKSLSTIVDAASLSSPDKHKLLAMVQSQHRAAAADDEGDAGAPAASVYKTSSTGVVDVLEDLKEKAEEQLSSLRKAEGNAQHNFNMLQQSLNDQVSADSKAKDAASEAKAAAQQKRAVAEGDLEVTTKDLAEGENAMNSIHASCLQKAADHEATVASRKEELAVLEKAKGILKSSTGGAAGQTYSMLQVEKGSHMLTRTDLARHEVVALVKQLAQKQHSAELAQLASRISAVMQYGMSAGEDPFAKVKDLITGLINKLESEGSGDANEKAYCDEQLSKTSEKRSELEEDVTKLGTNIDQATARSASLKAEVKQLQADLAALAKSQAEMDKIRAEEHADYNQAKEDLEAGLAGVRNAIEVLREYYGSASASALLQESGAADQPAAPELHSKSGGAGNSILEILEVVESDFAKNLAAVEGGESDAESAYERTTQENSVVKTLKSQDVKYKDAESKALDKSLADLATDHDTKDAELSAVNDYFAKVKDRCVAKAETYEERGARRAAEIAGLKEALDVLENEVAFTQRRKRGGLRGHVL